jgi:hypothetical protein
MQMKIFVKEALGSREVVCRGSEGKLALYYLDIRQLDSCEVHR